ncbi:MAG TPA: ferritin-like domain-containing protein [Candidatus Binatia bacterium]|nr:ferritin-like domain-containing protein [Candidatus Binatia bacterium]
MPAASTTLHEPSDELTAHTIDVHRAIVSLIEELEAVDWYNQRAEACKDAHLKAVLAHNRDEEIEHATMTLEWIRRHMPKFDETLKLYLFTKGDITAIEEAEQSGDGEQASADSRHTVGDMKGS